MSSVIKTYLGIFMLIMSVFTLVGIISADMDAGHARDFHSSVIAEIEDADFAPSVVAECIAQADRAGYDLLIDEESCVYDEDGKVTMMEVVLQYDYSVDFLDLLSTQQIRGFAR